MLIKISFNGNPVTGRFAHNAVDPFSHTERSTGCVVRQNAMPIGRPEEAGLSRKLADFFMAVMPAINDASVEKLAADLQDGINQSFMQRQMQFLTEVLR